MALEKLIKNLMLAGGFATSVYLSSCGKQPEINVYNQSPQQQTEVYVCSDKIDNDGDILIDNLDPGCYNNGIYFPTKTSEVNEPVVNYQCSDEIDNDGDGLIDYEDAGCYTDNLYNPNDNDELDVIIPKNIVINEFEQNPITGSEWVEIYNTSSVSMDISEWMIYDILSSPKVIHKVLDSTTLAPGEYYTTDVNTYLNNDLEGLTLRDPTGTIIYDETPTLSEVSPATDNCWARVPNGVDTNTPADWTFQTCTRGTTNNELPDLNTMGLWHMDESSWNGTLDEVIDSSIYGNHGTAYGNATTTSDGKINKAGTFDGAGDYIQIPHNDLMNTSNITVEAYVYLNNLNKSQRIVDRFYYPGGRMWSFHINPSNQLTLNISSDCSSGSLEFSTATPLNANQWYHVAFTYDGSNIKILQDGNTVVTQPYTDGICTTGTSPITIGAYCNGSESFFDGKIDEVIISDIIKY